MGCEGVWSESQISPRQTLTWSSIWRRVVVESVPNGGYLSKLFSRVVTWSHLAQQSKFRLPSPFLIGTRTLNFLCSTLVTATTQTSRANLLRASTERINAGRGLSSCTK